VIEREFERRLRPGSKNSKHWRQAEFTHKVMAPEQGMFETFEQKTDVAATVAKGTKQLVMHTISIPEIVVLPTRDVNFGFDDLDLSNLETIAKQPLSDQILVQRLWDDTPGETATPPEGLRGLPTGDCPRRGEGRSRESRHYQKSAGATVARRAARSVASFPSTASGSARSHARSSEPRRSRASAMPRRRWRGRRAQSASEPSRGPLPRTVSSTSHVTAHAGIDPSRGPSVADATRAIQKRSALRITCRLPIAGRPESVTNIE
jgi:hypothetical protein